MIVGSYIYFELSIKMFLIFLKMGQTAISYVYTPAMAVVILLQYHVLWPFTIRGKFFRLDQSETSNWKSGPIRDPHATRHKRSVLNSMLLSISKSRDNWERERGELDVIYLMSLTFFSQVTSRICISEGIFLCCVTAPAFVWYLLTWPGAPGGWWVVTRS